MIFMCIDPSNKTIKYTMTMTNSDFRRIVNSREGRRIMGSRWGLKNYKALKTTKI